MAGAARQTVIERQRRSRFAAAALAAFAGLGFAVVLGLLWARGRGLPKRLGRADIPGLEQAVRVRFDRFGVPHVDASCAADLFAASGWLHANDRMFQLELGRRSVRGRLAEAFGPSAFALDVRARELRLLETAQACLERLEPESRAALDAYASGVNAWLVARGNDLPPEFLLARIQPAQWTALDSLCFHVLLAKDLCATFLEERRWNWLTTLGPERTADLVGGPAPKWDQGLLDLAHVQAQRRPANLNLPHSPPAPPAEPAANEANPGGSNAWAVGTSRSSHGAPLVASDPHLRVSLPNIWYQARLSSPEYAAQGMMLPGLPLVVIGQTEALAWAFTNVEADLYDVWIERTQPDGLAIWQAGDWLPVTQVSEHIPVQGEPERKIELRSTSRGPLVTFGINEQATLGWTLYEAFDPIAPFLGLARASTVDDVEPAIATFVCPVQNMIVADRQGGVLQTIMGRVPNRNNADGRFPLPGWDAKTHWSGLVTGLERSNLRGDRMQDVLASANDDARGPLQMESLAADFATPHRRERIRERLLERQDWTSGACAQLQGDVVDKYAKEVVELMPKGAGSEPARRAENVLRAWDGSMEVTGPSALFALFARELQIGLFSDEFWPHGLELPAYPERDGLLLRALSGATRFDWFDDARTQVKEDRRGAIEAALTRAWNEGERRWGRDVTRWRWGDLHQVTLAHPMADLPWIGPLFRRGPFGVPGSANCIQVQAGSWSWTTPEVQVVHAASMRWVADLGDPDRSLALLPSGQSGHPFDVHFDDQVADYYSNAPRYASWSEAAIARATVQELTLEPTGDR